MIFYLGTHKPHWLGILDVPLFISHRRLRDYKRLPWARAPWCLDSGGFTELGQHGRWVTSMSEYVDAAWRYYEDVGRLRWAAPMDWMCEPSLIERTGLSVREHQERTVQSYLDLTERAPGLPFIPVLQGWELADYERCVELYESAGVDLTGTVGVGSVARRQQTDEVDAIFRALHERGLSMHGFGVKMTGLRRYGELLQSADSMAWSFAARYGPPLPGHRHAHCQHCPEYALQWRERVLDATVAKT